MRRTTITIADDVAAEMAHRDQPRERYVLHPRSLGAKIDLSNTAEVLDLLDQAGR